MPGQGLAERLPLVVIVRVHDEVVHLGKENGWLHRQSERGPRARRPDGSQLPIEFCPVVRAVPGVDPVVLAEENPDGPRPQLTNLLSVRLDHRVALQAALSERERRHVPVSIRLREIHLQSHRFGGGKRGGED